MKKLALLILAIISISFINSCREDGNWENEGQFGFTVDRDTNFIEKAVGEVNPFKLNVHTNYDFSSIPMTFKFTTSLTGTLKLNGSTLTANTEYPLTNAQNIFEYTGQVSGTHDVIITLKNSKGISVSEKFNFTYGTSEFTHTYNGGTSQIFQGDPTTYTMKVVPASGQPSTGYQIRFNSFNGDVQLNGVDAQIGTYLNLNNIDNFTVTLKTSQSGQGKLTYSIKNSTVSKDYEIQQNVIARQINIESMNINTLNPSPNTSMSLIGVIQKAPLTTNNTVEYKTWISSASNNNMSGIQNTNNVFVPYTLGANGSFTYNFNALAVGNYSYNIQFKDEYGNLSSIKTFDIEVQNLITINQNAVTVKLQRNTQTYPGNQFLITHKYVGANLICDAITGSGGTNKIAKVVFELNYNYNGSPKYKTYTYNYNSLPSSVNVNENPVENEQLFSSLAFTTSSYPLNATNGTYTVYVTDNLGNVKTATGTTYVQIL